MSKKFTFLMAACIMLLTLINLPMKVRAASDQVTSQVATTNGEYVIAIYYNGDYYALPKASTMSTATTYSGVKVILNSAGKVNTSDATDITWKLVEGSTSGQFYIQQTIGNTTYYLYKNGTSGSSNRNIKTVTSGQHYWEFKQQSDTYQTYSVKSLRGSASLFFTNNSGTSTLGVYTSTNSGITLLEVGDVPTGPFIATSETSLTGFTYVAGSGPSASQSFKVSGSNLGENTITVVLNENSDYDMSESNETWSSITTKTLTPTDGTVGETTLYVRLKAGFTAGNHDGTVTVSTTATGVENKTISLSGSVTPTHTLTLSATNGTIEAKDANNNTITSGNSVAEGAVITLTATPAAGYKFQSWSESVANTTANPTTFTMGNGNATVTANFEARNTATVTLHHGPNGLTPTQVSTYTDATLGEVIEGHTPSVVNGWTVVGWVKGYTSGTPSLIDNSELVGTTTNLYAAYTKGSNTFQRITSTGGLEVDGTYMIIGVGSSKYYALNAVSGNYMSQTEEISVTDNSFDYSVGRKFVLGGSDSEGYTFYDGSNYLTGNSSSENNLTLGSLSNYGKWTINFSSNVAQIKNKQNTSYYVSYYANKSYFNCYTATNTVYLFKQITNVQYSITPVADNCTVTYDANGGTGDAPIDNTQYAVGATVTVAAGTGLSKTHYTFDGWNTAIDGSGASYSASETFPIIENTTLYAQWMLNTHTVTLPENDAYGTYTMNAVNPVAYNTEVTLTFTPASGNYNVTWYVNDEEISGNTFNMPDEDVTVTVDLVENPFATVTLTSDDMTGITGEIAYGIVKSVTVGGYYWETNGQQETARTFMQIRARSGNSEISYVKLPSFNGKIETITMSVTNGSGGNWSKTVYFNDAVTNNDSDYIVNATGSNVKSITLDLSGKFCSTGYILASGATRIYQIDVVYRPYKDMTGTALTTIEADRTVSIPANTNATAASLNIPASSGILIKSGASLTVSGTLTNQGDYENLIIEDGGQLICSNSVAATVKKSTDVYSAAKEINWYAISSPVDYVLVTSFVKGEKHNVYSYITQSCYWNEYRGVTDPTLGTAPFANLTNGRGYIYRSQEEGIEFKGDVNVGNITCQDLGYTCSNTKYNGFNLIGNPFTHEITWSNLTTADNIKTDGFYTLTTEGEWATQTIKDGKIAPMQAFMVQANTASPAIVISNIVGGGGGKGDDDRFGGDQIMFNVENSEYSDVAYVLFKEGHGLNKIEHRNDRIPMIYIIDNDENFAIADMPDNTSVINLGFEAMTMGKYTISLKANGQYSYMHLFDKFTGDDIDMLVEDGYTFIGSQSDRKDRFVLRLNYNAANIDNESDIFAYQSGSDIIISGEGELQIFDVTGRKVMTTTLNGVEAINGLSQGVYIFRVIGENQRTQKIVVR